MDKYKEIDEEIEHIFELVYTKQEREPTIEQAMINASRNIIENLKTRIITKNKKTQKSIINILSGMAKNNQMITKLCKEITKHLKKLGNLRSHNTSTNTAANTEIARIIES